MGPGLADEARLAGQPTSGLRAQAPLGCFIGECWEPSSGPHAPAVSTSLTLAPDFLELLHERELTQAVFCV